MNNVQRRRSRTNKELCVTRGVWKKTSKDIDVGRAGQPLDLWEIERRECLLVEVFGVIEH